MDPIDTLASILLDPSKGSKETTYFASKYSVHTIGFSYSSVTITHTFPDDLKALIKTSSEMTSSFFYVSPLAFLSPPL